MANKEPSIFKIELYQYNDVIDILEETKGYDVRDFAGRYKKTHEVNGELVTDGAYRRHMKLLELGYTEEDFKCLGIKNPEAREDWAKDSPEMQKRIEMNTRIREFEFEQIPYLDFWHEVMNDDTHNGSKLYISTKVNDHEDKPWVYTIIKDIMELFPIERYPLMYEGGYLVFWVEW